MTSPDERKQILKRSGRCSICLKKLHVNRNCRSLNRCRKCGGRYLTSTCSRGSSGSSRTDNKSRVLRDHRDSTHKLAHSYLRPLQCTLTARLLYFSKPLRLMLQPTISTVSCKGQSPYGQRQPTFLLHPPSAEILSVTLSETAEDADQDFQIGAGRRAGM